MHSGLWVLGHSVPLSPGILAACTLSCLHPTPHVGPCPRVSGPTSQFQVPPRLWTPAAHSWVSSLCEPIHLVPAPLCPIHAWLWAGCTPSAHVSKTVCALSCPFQEQLRRGQQAHSGVWPKANANPGIAGTGRQQGRGGGWPWGGETGDPRFGSMRSKPSVHGARPGQAASRSGCVHVPDPSTEPAISCREGWGQPGCQDCPLQLGAGSWGPRPGVGAEAAWRGTIPGGCRPLATRSAISAPGGRGAYGKMGPSLRHPLPIWLSLELASLCFHCLSACVRSRKGVCM